MLSEQPGKLIDHMFINMCAHSEVRAAAQHVGLNKGGGGKQRS